MKQVFNPPIKIKEIASIYESESIGVKFMFIEDYQKMKLEIIILGKVIWSLMNKAEYSYSQEIP